jgi:hypothetical protein
MKIHLDFLFLLMPTFQIRLLTCLFWLIFSVSFAQIKELQPIPPAKYLYGDGAGISTYDSSIQKYWGYQILLHNGHRIASRFGGGAVFDLDSIPNQWVRLDSSNFFGYNNGSLNISRNGTLYKYGGYGFWMNHGLLLKLKNFQWEFEHQNREVKSPGFHSAFYHPNTHQIFSFLRPTQDQSYADENASFNFSVYSMDIDQKEWKYLGDFRKEYQNPSLQILLKSPKGFLATLNSGAFVFFNVENRKSYFLNQKLQSKIIDLTRWKEKYQILQSQTGWVLFPSNFRMNQQAIPYLSFDEFDKNLLEGPVFCLKPLSFWPLLVGFLLSLIFSFWAWYEEVRKRPATQHHNSLPTPLDEIPFDFKEVLLISWMIDQKETNPQVSVLEVNAVLEIEGKTLDHQKKIRSEVIKSINNKYFTATGKVELIQRKPNSVDKRLVDYGLAQGIG